MCILCFRISDNTYIYAIKYRAFLLKIKGLMVRFPISSMRGYKLAFLISPISFTLIYVSQQLTIDGSHFQTSFFGPLNKYRSFRLRSTTGVSPHGIYSEKSCFAFAQQLPFVSAPLNDRGILSGYPLSKECCFGSAQQHSLPIK